MWDMEKLYAKAAERWIRLPGFWIDPENGAHFTVTAEKCSWHVLSRTLFAWFVAARFIESGPMNRTTTSKPMAT
jgi:hypothetical protein